MAASPGHPLLATVIETVVNHVRNRFTSVDVMQTMCPQVDFRLSHSYDVLFTSKFSFDHKKLQTNIENSPIGFVVQQFSAGPCILGASLNKLIGRETQSSFEPGEFLSSVETDRTFLFPGRFIFLNQAKDDMGAHRFTYLERNLIVAATDMPDYDDRVTTENGVEGHYSKLRKKAGIYGQEGLYADNNIANEDIRFKLNN